MVACVALVLVLLLEFYTTSAWRRRRLWIEDSWVGGVSGLDSMAAGIAWVFFSDALV